MKAAELQLNQESMQATGNTPGWPQDASFLALTQEMDALEFDWHLHAEHELTLIVQGQGKRFVGDDVSPFASGDLVLLGPNLPHSYVTQCEKPNAQPSSRAIVIYFRHDFLGSSFFAQPELRKIDRLLQRSRLGLQFHGPERDEASRQLMNLRTQFGFSRLSALLQVLHTLACAPQTCTISTSGHVPSIRGDDDVRIRRFFDYVNANLTRLITSTDIAAHMHMSTRTLTRFLRRKLGMTLVDYVNERRIRYACAQLISSDSSVAEICFKSGFRSLSHFNRQFRTMRNMTPRDYRRTHSLSTDQVRR